jgi:hypothetical protein
MRLAAKSAVICILGSLLALPAMAQMNESTEAAPGQSMETNPAPAAPGVTNGNTTIEFQSAAANPDINQQDLAKWGDFAEAHPKVAHALAYKPSLMNDAAYLRRHPELGAFFNDNPQIRDAMAENPGNFVAIPPRPGE